MPERLHFFVFEPNTSCSTRRCSPPPDLAALYPIWLAARLPIAATLRRDNRLVTAATPIVEGRRPDARLPDAGRRVTALGHVSIRRRAGEHVAITVPSARQVDAAAPAWLRQISRPAARCSSRGAKSARYRRATAARIRLTRSASSSTVLPAADVTAWENVECPGEAGVPKGERRSARESCSTCRPHRPDRPPAVAALGRRMQGRDRARAGQRPPLLLADEPTGELDEATRTDRRSFRSRPLPMAPRCVVVVTHNPVVAARGQRRLAMKAEWWSADESSGWRPSARSLRGRSAPPCSRAASGSASRDGGVLGVGAVILEQAHSPALQESVTSSSWGDSARSTARASC